MKSSKGKIAVAGALETPAPRPVQRVGSGLRRTGRAGEISAARRDPPPPTGAGGLLKERLRARLYDLLAAEFTAHAKRSPTRKRLAAQLGQTPEEIGRWLAGPGAPAGDAAMEAAMGAAVGSAVEAAVGVAAEAEGAAKQEDGGLPTPAPAAKPARRAAAARKEPAPATAVPPSSLATGTTIALGATMVGPGVAALAWIDVNPVAQVEVIR